MLLTVDTFSSVTSPCSFGVNIEAGAWSGAEPHAWGGADSLTLKTKKNAVVFCFFLTKLSRFSAEQSSAALAEISRWIFLFFCAAAAETQLPKLIFPTARAA